MAKIVNDLVYTCLLPAQEDYQESIHLDGRWSAILKTAIWHTPWDGSASLYLDSWVQVLRSGFTTYNTGQCWECKRRLTSSWVIMSRFLSKTTFWSDLMLSANFSKVWKLQRWIMAKMNIYAVPPHLHSQHRVGVIHVLMILIYIGWISWGWRPIQLVVQCKTAALHQRILPFNLRGIHSKGFVW